MLSVGNPIPDISTLDQQGNVFSFSSLKGKRFILFFYPKDDSSVCTKEACNLRDNYSELRQEGYEVIGISTDDARSHQKFIAKYELPYTLLADTEHQVSEAFGVWAEKSMYGNKYMGILRTTFVINEEGYITHVFDKVKSADHTEQIRKELKKAAT